jgi:hypothetical protein
MNKYFFSVLLLFVSSCYAQESISTRIDYASAKNQIFGQIYSACLGKLKDLSKTGYDSKECKYFLKTINSDFYNRALSECRDLSKYREKIGPKLVFGSEFQAKNPVKFNKLNNEAMQISTICPLTDVSFILLKIKAIKELNNSVEN